MFIALCMYDYLTLMVPPPQYGLDTSEFTYNPSESHRFQQVNSQPTEERSRCTIMWSLQSLKIVIVIGNGAEARSL